MASWRRPLGRPCNVWLNSVQEDANTLWLSTLWRSEKPGSHIGTTNGSLVLRDNDDDDEILPLWLASALGFQRTG